MMVFAFILGVGAGFVLAVLTIRHLIREDLESRGIK